jgi:hypothetical protein
MSEFTPTLFAARRWFVTGVIALALAGLFAGLMLSDKAFFHRGLVVHVDLSVLVWFLAIACMLWQLYGRAGVVSCAALFCYAAGMLCIPLSSVFPGSEGLMNNYVPMITHPVFHLALGFILCGVALSALQMLFALITRKIHPLHGLHPCFADHAILFGVASAAVITLLSIAAFFLVYPNIPDVIVGEQFYELLFWAGGHILQFTHTQFVMIAWLWLAALIGLHVRLPRKALFAVFLIGPLSALAGIWGVFLPPTSPDYHDFYTQLMRQGNGIAPFIVTLAVLHALFTQPRNRLPENRAPFFALIASLALFTVGGLVGWKIDGSNVTVPAHYHGSIVGITLAYMGLCYWLMPRMGFAAAGHWRTAMIQPLLYGIGQLCWIAGMVILGGYGVARKQTGVPVPQTSFEKFGEILKHSGDGLALLGGLLFVVVVAMAWCKRPRL